MALNKFSSEILKKSRYSKFQDFHELMPFRVSDILLVSSLYDSFIFEEDGRLYELIRKEFQGLNLSNSPELKQVSGGTEALELAKQKNRYNLILVTLHIEDMKSTEFARKAREAGVETTIILLGYDNISLREIIDSGEINLFDNVFIWQGDFRLIIGIVKYLEDKMNVEHDVEKVGVQVIILVEDNILFYSSYLPMIYTEIMKQSQELISEGINLTHKFLRMRARPKILLCRNFEEAWKYYEKYHSCVLGIISDVDFPRNGKSDNGAGISLARMVKEREPDIPFLIQTTVEENVEAAKDLNLSFLLKDSPTLLTDLGKFLKEHFSFGDFVFRTEDGDVVGKARNLYELETELAKIPDASILYHAGRNHFSNWLKARTEFWLANALRPKKITDFQSLKELREKLIEAVRDYRISRQRGVISDFDKNTFNKSSFFARIGGGSIGGKARGLAFVNRLLSDLEIRNKFKGMEIFVPATVVIGTDIFDQFLEDNNLREFALKSHCDEEINTRFLEAENIPYLLIKDLFSLLEILEEPIAVRSSSLLEDSQGQPFAGVYDTFMLPNNNSEPEDNLKDLLNGIKLVYASTFHQKAKDYIKVTSYRNEEEKMAVVIQKVLGTQHENRFYPEFSGVAKSYNFYPITPLKPADGIVSVAVGLGKTIVQGGNTLRFCPKYPNHLIQLSTIQDTLRYSQQDFYALPLEKRNDKVKYSDEGLEKFNIDIADEDGVINYVGSTYDYEHHTIYDGVSRPGKKIFTMSPVLKYKSLPLPEILDLMLEMGSWGMGSPIEIEFACKLSVPKDEPKQFAVLQMRPLVISSELENLDLSGYNLSQLICHSGSALGNGLYSDIYDIVFVDKENFDRSKSREAAAEIADFNRKLSEAGRKYLLIGVGRWGSMDPWLGIPVTWDQISGARAIVEANFKDFNVTPSQGTHFFQNLTSFKVGYFTVDYGNIDNFIDWQWLYNLKPAERKKYTVHVRLKHPVSVKVNGKNNAGIITKPDDI